MVGSHGANHSVNVSLDRSWNMPYTAMKLTVIVVIMVMPGASVSFVPWCQNDSRILCTDAIFTLCMHACVFVRGRGSLNLLYSSGDGEVIFICWRGKLHGMIILINLFLRVSECSEALSHDQI